MYRGRDFDMVMVSANMPDEKEGVLKVLKKLHSSGRNLLFGSDDTYAMQAAFDKSWDSAYRSPWFSLPRERFYTVSWVKSTY